MILGGETLAAQVLEKAREAGAERLTFIFRKAPDAATAAALSEAGARVLTGVGATRLFGEGEALTGDRDSGRSRRSGPIAGRADPGFFPRAAFLSWYSPDPLKKKKRLLLREPGSRHRHTSSLPMQGEFGLFARGDVLTDFSGAIKAIAAGRRAAATIHMLIYDISLGFAG